MSNPLEITFTLPRRGVQFGATIVTELRELATAADESREFAAVWIGDSLPAKPRRDSIGLLGALPAVTQRVILGVGCMASFSIRDPATFAQQWARLEVLSGGRMLLATRTGIVAHDQASRREGGHWAVSDNERAPRLEENMAICRRLCAESNVHFAGSFTSYHGTTVEPKPIQNPCDCASVEPGGAADRQMDDRPTLSGAGEDGQGVSQSGTRGAGAEPEDFRSGGIPQLSRWAWPRVRPWGSPSKSWITTTARASRRRWWCRGPRPAHRRTVPITWRRSWATACGTSRYELPRVGPTWAYTRLIDDVVPLLQQRVAAGSTR